jgi:hypothetical protein
LRLGDEVAQMPPDEARQIGHWILEAAEAAEGDAALVRVCAKMGLDDRMAALLLRELRAGRGTNGGDVTATASGED